LAGNFLQSINKNYLEEDLLIGDGTTTEQINKIEID
jgi:hypothetical protein